MSTLSWNIIIRFLLWVKARFCGGVSKWLCCKQLGTCGLAWTCAYCMWMSMLMFPDMDIHGKGKTDRQYMFLDGTSVPIWPTAFSMA